MTSASRDIGTPPQECRGISGPSWFYRFFGRGPDLGVGASHSELRANAGVWSRIGRAWLGSLALIAATTTGLAASQDVEEWRSEWPRTDFSQSRIDLSEILDGGPPKDGIPAIDAPVFAKAKEVANLAPDELVISVVRGAEARAYPLRVMMWHEIVNDVIDGVPIAVTYCPLCNAALVFDRRIPGQTLSFGTTGKLLYSDLVMYDRQTESWWQQFSGEAIVGSLAGERLKRLPARLESWDRFRADHANGVVLIPENPSLRDYGKNPYVGYDNAARPFLYRGDLPDDIPPMSYVVAIGDRAWSLALLRRAGRIEDGDTVLTWQPGASSALDRSVTFGGRDIGNVVAYRISGQMIEIPYDLVFAFVFHAFHPNGVIRQ